MSWLSNASKSFSDIFSQPADSWNPFSPNGHLFANLTELADPFHIDPVGRRLHEMVAQNLDPYHSGPELNQQLQEQQAKQNPPGAPGAPNADNARLQALSTELDGLKKKRASNTLFGGALGLDSSPSASTTLLGA